MSEQSRERIFARLKSVAPAAAPAAQQEPLPKVEFSHREKIEKLKTLMEAMRTEVHITSEQDWPVLLEDILRQRKIKDLLYGPGRQSGKPCSKDGNTPPTVFRSLSPTMSKLNKSRSASLMSKPASHPRWAALQIPVL